MRKILALLLAALMALSLVACGDENTPANDNDAPDVNDSNENADAPTALEIFNKIWESYGEDEKFAAMGGDFDAMVNGAPGAYSIADAETAALTLKVPADAIAMTDDCVTLTHMMNANTFTGAIFHVTDKAKVQTVCDKAKEAVASEQWLCGFPDKHLVMVIEDTYVLSAFGNIDIMNTFRDKVNASGYSVTEAYWLDLA